MHTTYPVHAHIARSHIDQRLREADIARRRRLAPSSAAPISRIRHLLWR
jgi:hypothetical protein